MPAPCRIAVTGPSSASTSCERAADGLGVGNVGRDVARGTPAASSRSRLAAQLGVGGRVGAPEQGEPGPGLRARASAHSAAMPLPPPVTSSRSSGAERRGASAAAGSAGAQTGSRRRPSRRSAPRRGRARPAASASTRSSAQSVLPARRTRQVVSSALEVQRPDEAAPAAAVLDQHEPVGPPARAARAASSSRLEMARVRARVAGRPATPPPPPRHRTPPAEATGDGLSGAGEHPPTARGSSTAGRSAGPLDQVHHVRRGPRIEAARAYASRSRSDGCAVLAAAPRATGNLRQRRLGEVGRCERAAPARAPRPPRPPVGPLRSSSGGGRPAAGPRRGDRRDRQLGALRDECPQQLDRGGIRRWLGHSAIPRASVAAPSGTGTVDTARSRPRRRARAHSRTGWRRIGAASPGRTGACSRPSDRATMANRSAERESCADPAQQATE